MSSTSQQQQQQQQQQPPAALELPSNLKLSIKCKQLIRSVVQPPPPPPPPSLTVPVMDLMTGETLETIELDRAVFGCPIRRDVVHAVIRWQLACRRQGAGKTKTIGEVSGSGRKVRPQKGTGRARAGHSRPPHWRGGAKAHGPKGNRDWSYKLNKKIRKLGLRVALSAKLKEGKLTVVDSMTVETPKTGPVAARLGELGLRDSTLFVDGDAPQEEFGLATRNLAGVKVVWGGAANCYDMLKRDRLVLSREGLQYLQTKLERI
jgi:large subunit ribosomal protein L4